MSALMEGMNTIPGLEALKFQKDFRVEFVCELSPSETLMPQALELCSFPPHLACAAGRG